MKRLHLICVVLLLIPSAVFAIDNTDVISTLLENVVSLLQSKIARLSAVIALIYVGYSTLYLGRMEKERAFAVILGLGIIFSAGFIMEKLGYAT